MNPLLDAHAHLDHYTAAELPQVLGELRRRRIRTLAVAMDPPSYRRLRELAALSPWILPSFGVHPWRAPDYADRLEELTPWIRSAPFLGEIGLDYHWVQDAHAYPLQRRVLAHFLEHGRDKVMNLHTKGAEADILALLREARPARAIVHWYSGPWRIFEELLALGVYFTVGVEIHRSARIRELAAAIPEDRLLAETDNPGGLEWLTGVRGMPRHLVGVLEALAEVRGVDVASLEAQMARNGRALLGQAFHRPAR